MSNKGEQETRDELKDARLKYVYRQIANATRRCGRVAEAYERSAMKSLRELVYGDHPTQPQAVTQGEDWASHEAVKAVIPSIKGQVISHALMYDLNLEYRLSPRGFEVLCSTIENETRKALASRPVDTNVAEMIERRVESIMKAHGGVNENAIRYGLECFLADLRPVDTAQSEAYDLVQHMERQRIFSTNAFGPIEHDRVKGVIDHLRKEVGEIAENPTDPEEWVDVILLALDGMWRIGLSNAEIVEAIDSKLTKNINRTWPDWTESDPNKAIEHDRSEDTAQSEGKEPCGGYMEGVSCGTAMFSYCCDTCGRDLLTKNPTYSGEMCKHVPFRDPPQENEGCPTIKDLIEEAKDYSTSVTNLQSTDCYKVAHRFQARMMENIVLLSQPKPITAGEVDKEYDKAVAQFIGFVHKEEGYGLSMLVESMGLKQPEWEKIKEEGFNISQFDIEEVDAKFKARLGEGEDE